MRKLYTLTALALACAATLIIGAACKSGDGAGGQTASTTTAPAQGPTTATPHPTSTPGDNVRRTSLAETQQMLEKGTAIVVDVRPKSQYDQGHIKDSVSIPREQLPTRLSELPKEKLIIFYCA